MSKIGIIGDLHFRENLPYSEYVEDGRVGEEKEVLDFIVKTFEDCDEVVLLGDVFDKKNNPSKVITKVVSFIKRFDGKKVYIIAGNHEKTADGKSALDFLRKVNNPNWNIVTNKIEVIGDMTFLPYMTKPELEVDDDTAGTKKIMKELKSNRMLFLHHAISDSMSRSISTNIFSEVVLPKTGLEKKFDLVVGGHIHTPQVLTGGKTIVVGSVFNVEANEKKKIILKIDKKTLKATDYALPGISIHRLENPSVEDLKKIDKKDIVRVIINDPKMKNKLDPIKKELEKIEINMMLEQYPKSRKKTHTGKDLLNLSVKDLLTIYAKERKVDEKKLFAAFELL